MENLPNPENNQEKIEKKKVLDALKEKGFEHPETQKLVFEWRRQQEVLVDSENTSKASIVFCIEMIDLYIAMNDIEEAWVCVNEARNLVEMDASLTDREQMELNLRVSEKSNLLKAIDRISNN
jgi:hypothetical protein